jgi:hypothetical protein
MCLAFYVGADMELPLVPWDRAKPAFCVRPLFPEEEIVRRLFMKRYVVYIGASEGCGCGFGASLRPSKPNGQAPVGPSPGEDPDPHRDADLASMLELLHLAVGDSGAELYVCWDGEQGEAPDDSVQVSLSDLAMSWSLLCDRRMLRINRG